MSPISYKVSKMQKGYVIPSKSIKKKLKFPAQPVWNKMQGLFLLITQIEVRISLKHFGFFYRSVFIKKYMVTFFSWICHSVMKETFVDQQKFISVEIHVFAITLY